MIIEGVNVDPLLKAFKKFEKFRLHTNTEQEKAGAIQAYEYSFELVWKVMKRLLAERGKIANSPKEVFRMAALENFIEDPEVWFDFLKKRNITVHTYEEDSIEEVVSVFSDFSREMKQFLNKIGINDDTSGT